MDKPGWHAVLYHRLAWLWPLLFSRWARCLWQGLGWVLLAGLVAFAGASSYLRYGLMPRIGEYQPRIESALSEALGLQVRFGNVQTYWSGINPGLLIHDLSLTGHQGEAGLTLSKVQAELSWRTFLFGEPTLDLLAIDAPVLSLRRDAAGRISVAGLTAEGESDPRRLDWLLRQRQIRIVNATVDWQDDLRAAPLLHLEQVQFGLDNWGDSHRFGLTADPPTSLASRLSLRGRMDGQSLVDLAAWEGRLYADMDYVDLAAWTPWLAYPVALPRGRGGLRVWLDVAQGTFKLVADAALDDVRLRLGRQLPELDLIQLRGRFVAAKTQEDWHVAGRRLALATRDGVSMPPSTFEVDWRQDKDVLRGRVNADRLDFDALRRLAYHLPLDARSRALLQAYEPTGVMSELRASWESREAVVERYGLKGRFEALGLNPVGVFPGATGITGEVDASERGGVLRLASHKAELALPKIFEEPRLAFDDLQAKARWSLQKERLEVRLESFQFANGDAAGVAQGMYRHEGEGLGYIDLSASLSRAQATAVWRYLPLVVNAHARDWVKQALVAGKATEAKLELRGNLGDFPFRQAEQGKFLVAVKAKDASLEFAPGWPRLEGVSGDVRFQGPGMFIDAKQGKTLGVSLGPAKVEIPDFDAADPVLLVKGKGVGPAGQFLAYLEESPVGGFIDHFTQGMSANGTGHLDLELNLPLHRLMQSQVKGEFQLAPGGSVRFVEGLPPVTEVSGKLTFTEKSLVARDIRGHLFGAPLRLNAMTEGDKVSVNLNGGFSVVEARKALPWPFLDALAGSTSWKGEVKVRKHLAELVIDSNLAGITSSLPAPFNKTAATPLPLRIVKGALPTTGGVVREQLAVTLGKTVDAKLIRRQQSQGFVLERGAVGVGEAAKLPARGLWVSATLPSFDLDTWQPWMGAAGGSGDGGLPAGSVINLHTPVLTAHGRRFDEVSLAARPEGSGWLLGVNAKQVAGDIHWSSTGRGSVRADLRRLHLTASDPSASDNAGQLLNDLPSLDVRAADFAIQDRRFGRLEAVAQNESGAWRIDRLAIDNPDGRMNAKGLWRNQGGANRTLLEFELATENVGALLDRLGFPGAMKRGNAKLKGQVAWQGSPARLDYSTLAGDLKVEATKGQFAKLEPGIGKLLGLISLQSLPRRITLDFRDIFSDGFAFDSLESQLAIKDGVMRTTEDLRIDGPAARVLMKGEADLKAETQNLVVSVQPELGGAAAMGVALANPVVGVATLIASKVLQNPLNKLFAFQYKVTGTWDDPKVDKLGVAAPAAEAKRESK